MKTVLLTDKVITNFLKDVRKDKRFVITERTSETAIVVMDQIEVFRSLKARINFWITRFDKSLFHIDVGTVEKTNLSIPK